MTKPKTYGEYADQTPNVTVDIRVRDREITDDAWRVLNAEDELPQDIVEQFNMDSDKHTYIDYHDDENVVLTTTTAKESDYKIALFSGIVGERFEMRSLIRDEWNEYYSEVSSVDELFPSIEELNQSRTKENKRIARIGYERPTYQSYSRDAYILAERTRRYIQRRVEGMENVTLAKEHNFKQFRGGGCAIIDYEWKNPTRKETATRTITIDTNKDGIKISHNGKEYDDKICVIDGWNRGLCDTKFHFEFWPEYNSAELELEGRPLRGSSVVTSTNDVSKRKFDGKRNLYDISDYEKRNTDEVMRTLLEDGFKSIDNGKNTAVTMRHIRVEDLNLDGLDDECAAYVRDLFR